MGPIGNDWDIVLEKEFEKDYYHKLRQFLLAEYKNCTIFPDAKDLFKALQYTSYKDTKVVILGQDPYHGAGQANGLCFSVREGLRQPPSLQNIYKEVASDVGTPPPQSGDLTRWAKQGVLLLNTVLSVREGEANSHKNRGWEQLTDRVISFLNQREDGIVFLLWGAHAKTKAQLITNPMHAVLTSPHPSPLSAYNGFFGCKHFSKANACLQKLGKEEIIW